MRVKRWNTDYADDADLHGKSKSGHHRDAETQRKARIEGRVLNPPIYFKSEKHSQRIKQIKQMKAIKPVIPASERSERVRNLNGDMQSNYEF